MKKLLNKFSPKKGFIQHQLRRSGAGFTLIELLIVVAIIAALALAVFVALDPGQRIKDANNARRAADADTILTAIHASIVDNDGTIPTEVTTTETQIGDGATGCAITTGGCTVAATACVDLAAGLSAYLKSNPIDPIGATYTAAKTGYSVVRDANNIVTVRACGAQDTTVSVSR